MSRIPLAAVVALSLLTSLGCGKKKRNDDDEKPKAKVTATPPPPAPTPPSAPKMNVPFRGTFTQYAQALWKNGRRQRVPSNDRATLTIADGRATYDQTYQARGKTNRVIQVYTFTEADMKPVAGGGYDVAMIFQSISGDTQNYNPDKNNPKLEARKQAGGWEIGLLTTDTKGVMGGSEFK